MSPELQNRLSDLAAKLGISVEHLWGVLVLDRVFRAVPPTAPGRGSVKPKPCPYCGHPAQIVHVLDGPDYRPLAGTHPEIWCPKCQRATMCQCRIAENDAGTYAKPWQVWQLVGRWNARHRRRPLTETEVHLRRSPHNRPRLVGELREARGGASALPDGGWLAWLGSPEADAVREQALAEIRRGNGPGFR